MNNYENDTRGGTSPSSIFDYTVRDRDGEKVGTVNNLWPAETGTGYSFIGVSTGWLFGRDHVVPADGLRVDHDLREVHLPLSTAAIKDAPDFAVEEDITDRHRDEIWGYYSRTGDRKYGLGHDTGAARRETGTAREAELPVREEKLDVGKREVRDGTVRLRRIVRTETVNVPVELRREDVEVERIPASGTHPGGIEERLGEKEVTIPISHEEAVVQKKTEVTGAVRARKTTETRTENVSDTVRKEDVDVDRDDKQRRKP
jgi:uncharacterized protein (TIGR02271 family)